MQGQATGCGRLGLGTVQFGMDYGVTNAAGKVSPQDVSAILDYARQRGIGLLDTAALYGESEAAIGASGHGAAFDIVTKTEKVSDAPDAATAVARIERGFGRSLQLLRVSGVYGLLLHDPGDLLGPYGDAVWKSLEALRHGGVVRKIGVSVYEGREIDLILDRFDVDLVQLPFNALDDRLAKGGQLDALAARNVEVHARSVFLQGVLLQPPERLPPRLSGLRPVVRSMQESFTDSGLTVMEGLIASALHHNAIRRLIIGATSLRELQEIADAADRVEKLGGGFRPKHWAVADERLLNPARWNALSDAGES